MLILLYRFKFKYFTDLNFGNIIIPIAIGKFLAATSCSLLQQHALL